MGRKTHKRKAASKQRQGVVKQTDMQPENPPEKNSLGENPQAENPQEETSLTKAADTDAVQPDADITIPKNDKEVLQLLINAYYYKAGKRKEFLVMINDQIYVNIVNYKTGYYYKLIKDKAALSEHIQSIIKDEIFKYNAWHLLNRCIKAIMPQPQKGFWTNESAEDLGILCCKNLYLGINKWELVNAQTYNTNRLQVNLLGNIKPTNIAPIPIDNIKSEYKEAVLNPDTPEMDKFIAQIAGNDIELIIRIWQMIGYLLVPDNRAKKLFLLQGVTDSGKSVLAKFIAGFFPKDKVSYLSLKELTHKNAAEELFDKCLNITAEVPDRVLSAKEISTLKQLSGNDTMQIHTDFGSTNFVNRCKLLLITNNELRMKEPDRAFTNRIITIPFDNRVAEEFQHKGLLPVLHEEKDAVATKAILHYYRMLQSGNYVFAGKQNPDCKPEICYTLTETVDKERSVEDFVRSKCTLTGDAAVKTYTDDLYKAYTAYCKEKGIVQTMTKQGFSRNLSGICGGWVHKSKWREGENNANGFTGIMLNSNDKGVIKKFNV